MVLQRCRERKSAIGRLEVTLAFTTLKHLALLLSLSIGGLSFVFLGCATSYAAPYAPGQTTSSSDEKPQPLEVQKAFNAAYAGNEFHVTEGGHLAVTRYGPSEIKIEPIKLIRVAKNVFALLSEGTGTEGNDCHACTGELLIIYLAKDQDAYVVIEPRVEIEVEGSSWGASPEWSVEADNGVPMVKTFSAYNTRGDTVCQNGVYRLTPSAINLDTTATLKARKKHSGCNSWMPIAAPLVQLEKNAPDTSARPQWLNNLLEIPIGVLAMIVAAILFLAFGAYLFFKDALDTFSDEQGKFQWGQFIGILVLATIIVAGYAYYTTWSRSCDGVAYQMVGSSALQGVVEITDISPSTLPPVANTNGFPLVVNCQGNARTFLGMRKIHFYGWEEKHGEETKFFMASDPILLTR